MIVNPRVPLHRLVLSLSEALDCINPRISDHQQRVAYVAMQLARRLGLEGTSLLDVFLAAALHDMGIIGVENRRQALEMGQMEQVSWHSELGHRLLRPNALFANAAELIRHHHLPWDNGAGARCDGQPVPPTAHILVLADVVERMVDRSRPVLTQKDAIVSEVAGLSGKVFRPDCVEAFARIARPEAFWLDLVSPRIYSILLARIDWPALTIDESTIGPIGEVFARVVDSASDWTAVHSAGVAATAVELARRMKFSPRELLLMRAAGYLHDLGKLAVPTAILDKPGKLTDDEMLVVRGHTYHTFRILNTIGGLPQISEWAAFHHERLDGAGYPFGHAAADLTLGSRIMAVADVFTALREPRPYRSGPASLGRARNILDRLVTDNALDADVVAALDRDIIAIDATRAAEQVAYGATQRDLMALMGQRRTGVDPWRTPIDAPARVRSA